VKLFGRLLLAATSEPLPPDDIRMLVSLYQASDV
jgi:hypothetical protein